MNIMLASINERIREIGLRKAVGAKSANILTQFLIESMSITIIGGVIGIAIGSLFSYAVAVVARFLGYDWDFVITGSSIIVAVGVALSIGIIFGIFPAIRASRLDPIEALRYE
jgi:putative ABC transport system permease protein